MLLLLTKEVETGREGRLSSRLVSRRDSETIGFSIEMRNKDEYETTTLENSIELATNLRTHLNGG